MAMGDISIACGGTGWTNGYADGPCAFQVSSPIALSAVTATLGCANNCGPGGYTNIRVHASFFSNIAETQLLAASVNDTYVPVYTSPITFTFTFSPSNIVFTPGSTYYFQFVREDTDPGVDILAGGFTIVGQPPITETISVTTNSVRATFTISGPSQTPLTGSGKSSVFQISTPGTYTITYAGITGYVSPPPQTMIVSGGGQIAFSGIYSVIAVDISCSAGPLLSSAKLNALKNAGVNAVVVHAWGGAPPERQTCFDYVHDQLGNASNAALKTAAYCLLSFDHPDGTVDITDGEKEWSGAWQVDQALKAVGAEPEHLAFLALDVEKTSFGFGSSTSTDRIARIQSAIQQVTARALKPLIYTDRSQWPTVTNITGDTASMFSSNLLWDSFNDFVPSLSLDGPYAPGCPSGQVGAMHPWVPYGGWQDRAGKQYNIGCKRTGTLVGDVTVDLDVFDISLFGLP